jgi:hypothetical protein
LHSTGLAPVLSGGVRAPEIEVQLVAVEPAAFDLAQMLTASEARPPHRHERLLHQPAQRLEFVELVL